MYERDLRIEAIFPNLGTHYKILSPIDSKYNCIAFAADDLTRVWWPVYRYWPPNVPEREDLESFIACYKSLGYTECGLSNKFVKGFEKVAIYVDSNNIPKHAAKQFSDGNGLWKSKLGEYKDIEHTLDGLSGIFHQQNYGSVAVILKRKNK